MMNVHQLSITYVPEQDRILVRVNTRDDQELRCWFTRRLCLALMPVVDRAVGPGAGSGAQEPTRDPVARQTVAEFDRERSLRSSDFRTPYRSSDRLVPLFDPPLLVTEVGLTRQPDGGTRMACAEKLEAGSSNRAFQLNLTESLMHAFRHLLGRAVRQAQWRTAPAGGSTESPDATATAAERPRYLN